LALALRRGRRRGGGAEGASPGSSVAEAEAPISTQSIPQQTRPGDGSRFGGRVTPWYQLVGGA